ncbi:MAG TPA: FkbM family methyltransferase [Ignavibacteriales bacterium]|nr:FkbM family methyltransferase [Ignavibacteriales bacterium]
MKILQLDTFYSRPLEILYNKYPALKEEPFAVQMDAILRDGFAAVHTIAPYMTQMGYEAMWVVGNLPEAQIKWAKENGYSLRNPNNWLHEISRAQIETFRPDVLYTTNAMVFDSSFMRSLSYRPKLIIGFQASDIPNGTDWSEFDLFLSPLGSLRNEAIKCGARETEMYMPGFPVWIYDSIKSISPVNDLVFCGQWTEDLHKNRNKYLTEIVKYFGGKIKLDYHLSGQINKIPDPVQKVNNGACYGLQMHRYIKEGKIAFDARGDIRSFNRENPIDVAKNETANMRIFEVTGSGVLLLTEHKDNLGSYFEIGKEIETYKDSNELFEKINYYLANPKERDLIAENGRLRCHRDHSMANRIKQFDDIIRTKLGHKRISDSSGSKPTGTLMGKSKTSETDFEIVFADKDLRNLREIAKRSRFKHRIVVYDGLRIHNYDLLSLYMAMKDIFLHKIYQFETKNNSPVIIDGGGHIGLFTLFIKKKYPNAKVFIFEPEDESWQLLQLNLHENHLENVHPIKSGLFNIDGNLEFGNDHSDGSSIFSKEKTQIISVSKLSPYLNEPVDFMKLNIEGSELPVLKEIAPKLENVNELVIEYHGFPETGQVLHEILSILNENGFRYLLHDFDNETNDATKPPFHINQVSRFFLLIYAKRLFIALPNLKKEKAELKLLPVSNTFGFDRGTPIDRYYIEKFLSENRKFISGSVLEIGDRTYTRKFGTGVKESTVLSFSPAQGVDIVGNLETGENVPVSRFDCIILTQTIQFIYDFKSALRNACNALKPGGRLLVTASGISQISRYDMDRWGEYWRFTDKTLTKVLKEVAVASEVEVKNWGNVAIAKAFLDGFAHEEIPAEVLDYNDPDYQVLLTGKLVKGNGGFYNQGVEPTKKKENFTETVNVLLYHRVALDPLDTQLLSVSPKNFEEQIKFLKDNFKIVHLRNLIDEIKNKALVPNTIAITFDDGYLDNFTNALPILEKFKVPATIFVTAGMAGSKEEFWWDALERILFYNQNLPQGLNLSSDKENYDIKLLTAQDKLRAYEILHSILKSQTENERKQLLSDLLKWAGLSSEGRLSHRIMNIDQLRKIAGSPYIEIGSHTVSHQRLSSMGYDEQYLELSNSRTLLEAAINKTVATLSYPFGTLGDINNDTIKAARNAGYIAGIANYPDSVNSSTDVFRVPRWLVRNWNAETFIKWIASADKSHFENEMLSERNRNIINFLSR